jgi:hypothetical protein
MKLLLSQRNQIFQIIQNSEDLSPNDFKFSDNGIMAGGSHITEIIHSKSNYYFMISDSNVTFSPGNDRITYTTLHNKMWTIIISYFREWLVSLSREISIEDEWAKMEADSKYFDVNDQDNSMFSVGEQKLIVDKIENLKEDIKNTKNINTSEFEKINKKLDHLEEMVSKLGRIDWKNLFAGSIFSVMAGALIPPDAHQSIMDLFKRFFEGFKLLR